ncbi:MAG: hypothetical protein ACFFA6_06950 [Promethearchaeota archaeon]
MNRVPVSRFLFSIILGSMILSSIIKSNISYIEPQSHQVQKFWIPNSCTIFTVNISDTIYFGNNEDYRLTGTYMWLVPSQEITPLLLPFTIYGCVAFGFRYNNDPADGYAQGGMNDQGLCVDGNGLPALSLNPHPELQPIYTNPIEQTLFECANVSEVIHWYQTHYLGTVWAGQLHYADASGDAVVVSVGLDGEFAFTRKNSSHYLVSTNFNLANYANGYYPCSRYDTATSMLASITDEVDLTIGACRDILDAVHAEGEYATKYSNIFDPVNLEFHLFYNHNFDKMKSFDLIEELGKVHPGGLDVKEENGIYYKEVAISSLFSESAIPGYPLIILIASIAIITSIFVLLNLKRYKVN